MWTFNNTDDRLDETDGEFVDIMHTNGGLLVAGNVAFNEPVGHVDFYVNGGHKQPGCPILEFGQDQPPYPFVTTRYEIIKNSVLFLFRRPSIIFFPLVTGCCSHCRAIDLYTESINTAVGFVSLQCDSYAHFQGGTCAGNRTELMGDRVRSE